MGRIKRTASIGSDYTDLGFFCLRTRFLCIRTQYGRRRSGQVPLSCGSRLAPSLLSNARFKYALFRFEPRRKISTKFYFSLIRPIAFRKCTRFNSVIRRYRIFQAMYELIFYSLLVFPSCEYSRVGVRGRYNYSFARPIPL